MIYRKFYGYSNPINSILLLLDQIWNMLPQSGIPHKNYRLMHWKCAEIRSEDVPQILE